MIIRVMTDNQYRVDDTYLPEIDKLDDALVAAIATDDAANFTSSLGALLEFVQQKGEVVPVEEVVPSDAILPAPDMTLEETKELLGKAEIKMPTS